MSKNHLSPTIADELTSVGFECHLDIVTRLTVDIEPFLPIFKKHGLSY